MRYIEDKVDRLLNQYSFNSAPIDVKELAKKMGVKVEGKDLDEDLSGIFVLKDDQPFVVYNKKENRKRIRFTIAHELGHFFLHAHKSPLFIDKPKGVHYRNDQSSTGEIRMEREANAFAAALLMPRALIEKEFQLGASEDMVEDLAKTFNVSTQAMSFRLSNLGYDLGIY
jgi:Zn-dependent peptidase ImmA (M78 family)